MLHAAVQYMQMLGRMAVTLMCLLRSCEIASLDALLAG